MVNYYEGDPTIPGNAELELHELTAFRAGTSTIVSEAGRDYGDTCAKFVFMHKGDASSIVVGMKALMKQPELTLTSHRMGLPFIEGVQAGARSRFAEIAEASAQSAQIELVQGLAALATFGQRPEVQAEAARQTRESFDNVVRAVQSLKD